MSKANIDYIVMGHGSPQERTVDVVSWSIAEYPEGRTGIVQETPDGDFAIRILNAPGTGREPVSQILLSRKSVFAMMCTLHIHFRELGIDIEKEILSIAADGVAYECSPNMNQEKHKEQ
jgi:hypothetical protein